MKLNTYIRYNDILKKEGVAALINTLQYDYENDIRLKLVQKEPQKWISSAMDSIHDMFPDTFKDPKIANDLDELFPFVCPVTGSFKAYKKIAVKTSDNMRSSVFIPAIAMLTIPSEAKRSSAFSRKCRASMAFVDDIVTTTKSVKHFVSGHSCIIGLTTFLGLCEPLEYVVGTNVYPDYFDDDRWEECSHGIHFFMTKEEAIDY